MGRWNLSGNGRWQEDADQCSETRLLKVHSLPERTQPSPLGPAAALLPVLGWAPADHSCPRSGTRKGSALTGPSAKDFLGLGGKWRVQADDVSSKEAPISGVGQNEKETRVDLDPFLLMAQLLLSGRFSSLQTELRKTLTRITLRLLCCCVPTAPATGEAGA